MDRLVRAVSSLCAGLAGLALLTSLACDQGSSPSSARTDIATEPLPSADPSPRIETACPVTQPDPSLPVPSPVAEPFVRGHRGPAPLQLRGLYGNQALWVMLPPDGRVEAMPDGDSLSVKFPWVRLVDGALTIAGRRLDAPAPPARADVPDGYGLRGFQASGVRFPTEGCWELSGRLAGHELRFVVWVHRRGS